MKIFNTHLNIVILLGLILPLATLLYLTPVSATPTYPTHLTANTTLTVNCTGTIYLAANSVTLNCASKRQRRPQLANRTS